MRLDSLSNYYVLCQSDQKLGLLLHLIRQRPNDKIIVYFATCACVDFFSKVLLSNLPHLVPGHLP